jgi:quinol-cytochrome oxidoreductase complex cytochrome b subunit
VTDVTPRYENVRALVIGFLLLFLLQAFTGALLVTAYDASAAHAHESVRSIDTGPAWVVRSLHAWTADGLLIVALVAGFQMVSTRPEVLEWGNWLPGLVIVGALLAGHLTGGILTWDQQGWESYQHLSTGLAVPTERPTDAALSVVAVVHFLLVPLLAVVALLWTQRRHLRDWSAADLVWLLRKRIVWFAALLLIVLSVLVPPFLGPAPIEGISVSRPDWPFAWLGPIQDLVGPAGVWALPFLGVLAAASAAFLRRWDSTRRAGAAVVVFLGLGVLTVVGYV